MYCINASPIMSTTTQNQDPIRGELRTWRVDPPADPGFRPAVWSRIDQARLLHWTTYWRRHAVGWSVACVLIVSASALWGHAAGLRHKQAERTAVLQTYLAAIDVTAMNR